MTKKITLEQFRNCRINPTIEDPLNVNFKVNEKLELFNEGGKFSEDAIMHYIYPYEENAAAVIAVVYRDNKYRYLWWQGQGGDEVYNSLEKAEEELHKWLDIYDPETYCIVAGTPFEGLKIYGPYEHEEAIEEAGNKIPSYYEIVPIAKLK